MQNTIQGRASNERIAIMDVHDLIFKDESFDTVIDTFGLESTYDLKKAISEMKRVLKQGGKLIMMERGQSVWLFQKLRNLDSATVNIQLKG